MTNDERNLKSEIRNLKTGGEDAMAGLGTVARAAWGGGRRGGGG